MTVELKAFDIPLSMYPINLMRNEARKGAHSKLHIVADIETRFSDGFAEKVRPLTQRLLKGDFGKSVFVYRRFELEDKIEFPSTVQELEILYDNKKFVLYQLLSIISALVFSNSTPTFTNPATRSRTSLNGSATR